MRNANEETKIFKNMDQYIMMYYYPLLTCMSEVIQWIHFSAPFKKLLKCITLQVSCIKCCNVVSGGGYFSEVEWVAGLLCGGKNALFFIPSLSLFPKSAERQALNSEGPERNSFLCHQIGSASLSIMLICFTCSNECILKAALLIIFHMFA